MIRRPADAVTAGAILVMVAAYVGYGLMTASTSLGCDFLAYFNASVRWVHQQPIYDLATTSTGSCGTFQYPPPFVLLAAPFSFLGFELGNWAWIGFLIACWVVGTAILPVRTSTRWMILILGAIGWPLIFGVRIGQVSPILYLVFAVAWRSLDEPRALGAAVALGTLVKLQPVVLGGWLLARRQWRAIAFAAVTALIVTAAAAIVGLRDWLALLKLLGNLSDAVTQPLNVALGAALFQQGVPHSLASALQTLNTVVMVGLVLIVALRLPAVPAFLAAVIATQLVSPIVWTHYAVILLIPVAWLLDRRRWWAALIPLTQAWLLVPVQANWWYTAGFYLTFAAVVVVGWRDIGSAATATAGAPARFGQVRESTKAGA